MAFRAPPGLENVVPLPGGVPGHAASARAQSGLLSCQSDKYILERSGDRSPVKIRVDALYCAPTEPTRSGDSPPLETKGKHGQASVRPEALLASRPSRPGLQRAAYSASNASGWFSVPPPPASMPSVPPGIHGPAHPCPAHSPSIGPQREQNSSCCKGKSGAKSMSISEPSDGGKQNTGSKASGRTSGGRGPKVASTSGCSLAAPSAQTNRRIAPGTLLKKLNTDGEGLSLIEVLPCLGAVAQDKDGAEFLQARLLEAPEEVRAMVFSAAFTELETLSTHQFGHAFILQMLEVANVDQRKAFVEKISPHVKTLTLDSHGCRVVQRALQRVPRESREQLIGGLKECAVQCIKNMHGNHVMSVCIEEMPPASVAFLIDAVATWGAESASAHIYGCRVVMRLLEYAQRQQMQEVMLQVFQSVSKLAQDRYGNYVLQHILEHGDVCDRKYLMSQALQCGVQEFAKQKYARNVIEKCIQVAWSTELEASFEAERLAFCQGLFLKDDGESTLTLASDKFGVMVLQCLLDHLRGSALKQLTERLLQIEMQLEGIPHAETLLAKLRVTS